MVVWINFGKIKGYINLFTIYIYIHLSFGVRVMIEPQWFKMNTFKWKRHTENHIPFKFSILGYIYIRVMIEPKLFQINTSKCKRHTEKHIPFKFRVLEYIRVMIEPKLFKMNTFVCIYLNV